MDYKEQLLDLFEQNKFWIEGEEKEALIERFMDGIGTLFLEYFKSHLDEAKEWSRPYHEVLRKSVGRFDYYYVHEQMRDIEGHSWKDPDWDLACKVRTNIESFNTMLGSTVGKIDDEELVEFMDQIDMHFFWPESPNNVPLTHWWWQKGL
jgi:hypothetical protein